MSGSGATPFSTSKGSGSGLLDPSRTAIPITGALDKNVQFEIKKVIEKEGKAK